MGFYVYKEVIISEKVMDFFKTEDGLSVDQLVKIIDKRWLPLDHFDCFEFECVFDLVKFYRDHPSLSIEELLQYNRYAIQDLAIFDKKFKFQFHEWLLEHHLKIPYDLTNDRWGGISTLCCASGLEYLKRKILSFPKLEWQTKLNDLVKLDPCVLQRDVESILANRLVDKNEVSWFDTVDDRFIAYKERKLKSESEMANTFTRNGLHSLLWQNTNDIGSPKVSEEVVNVTRSSRKFRSLR